MQAKPTPPRSRRRLRVPRGFSVTLPIRPHPSPGESFASYVDRLAAFWEVRLQTMLALTGVVDEDHGEVWPVAYGISLSPARLETFSYVTRMPEERVTRMLLSGYDGIACDFTDLDPGQPKSLRRAARGQWAYFVGSHACPSCLEESAGAWKLAWKLPWSFACVRHRCLLLDNCPSCARRTGAGRMDGKCAPPFTSRVPVPGACRNALLPQTGSRRKISPGPCMHPLYEVEAFSLEASSSSRLLDTQLRLDGAMEGIRQSVGGEEISSVEYFADLRSLCALILSHAAPEDLGKLPDPMREAFATYAEEREALRVTRSEHIAAGSHRKGRPYRKIYTATPQSATLMAAVLPTAAEALHAPTPEAMAEALYPLASRALKRVNLVRQEMGSFGFSGRLTDAFERCWRPRMTTVRRLGIEQSDAKEVDPALEGLRPEHVPQRLYKAEFEALFAELFGPGILSKERARAFCSMALVRLVGNHTWEQAATELGLPQQGEATGNVGVTTLNWNGNIDLFGSRLRELAWRLAQDPHPTNYGLRRRMLADLDDIESLAWIRICEDAGMRRGKTGRRSGAASAWLWSELTGGSWQLAPWFLKNNDKSSAVVFRRFLEDGLEKLKDGLLVYGEDLLESFE